MRPALMSTERLTMRSAPSCEASAPFAGHCDLWRLALFSAKLFWRVSTHNVPFLWSFVFWAKLALYHRLMSRFCKPTTISHGRLVQSRSYMIWQPAPSHYLEGKTGCYHF